MTRKSKTVREIQADAMQDPEFRATVETARAKYMQGLTLLQEATEAVGPAGLDLVIDHLEGTLFIINPDTDWEFKMSSIAHVEVHRDDSGVPVSCDFTVFSSETEDEAGYECEADYLAATEWEDLT